MESDFDFIGRGNPIFSRQHHAQVIGQDRTHTIISLFDNAIGTGPNEYKTNSMARGLILLLNTVDWTASILSEYRHPRGSTVNSRGEAVIQDLQVKPTDRYLQEASKSWRAATPS